MERFGEETSGLLTPEGLSDEQRVIAREQKKQTEIEIINSKEVVNDVS